MRFPNTKQLGDVTKIDGTKIEAPDILTAGSPCFVAGTLVHTEDGLKPIELVCEDWDFVLAEDGKYHRVTETMCRESNDIYELKAQGMLTTEVTENHPLLVRHMKRYYPQLGNGKRGNFRRFSNPEWVQVKDLKKTDFVAFPIIKEERNTENITEEEAWLIGRYIADGYINNRQRSGRPQGQVNHKVIFCIGKRKVEDFKKKVTTYHVCPKEDRTAYKCEIISERLVKLCLACGCGAINKEIPYKYLALPKSILKALITGYLDGDGCYHTLKKSYSATTISRKLALSLQLGIHKVLHIPCKLYFNKRPPTCVIEGRTVNQHDTYMLSWKTYIPKQSRAIVDENYVWQPIRSVIKVEKTAKVYNLEVDQVHSYCANGIVVHNCQDLSIAGKREGLAGERSGLFINAINIVRQMRMSTGGRQPRFFIWENVPGAFTSGSERGADFRAVLEEIGQTEIPMPKDGRWANAGMVQCPKCEIAWRVLDAQFWGVPQRRKRIFLVADFAATDRRAGKILFVEPSLSGNTEQSRETRKRVASTIEKSIRTASELVHCGGGQNEITIYDMTHAQDVIRENKQAPTLNARMGTGGNQVPILLVSRIQRETECKRKRYWLQGRTMSNTDCGNTTGCNDDERSARFHTETTDPLTACDYKQPPIVATIVFEPGVATRDGGHVYTEMNKNKFKAFCKHTNCLYSAYGTKWNGNSAAYNGSLFVKQVVSGKVRRLTPLECERLQGLPDGWTLINDKSCSDSARYKAIGNGMAQPCADYVIQRIVGEVGKT